MNLFKNSFRSPFVIYPVQQRGSIGHKWVFPYRDLSLQVDDSFQVAEMTELNELGFQYFQQIMLMLYSTSNDLAYDQVLLYYQFYYLFDFLLPLLILYLDHIHVCCSFLLNHLEKKINMHQGQISKIKYIKRIPLYLFESEILIN